MHWFESDDADFEYTQEILDSYHESAEFTAWVSSLEVGSPSYRRALYVRGLRPMLPIELVTSDEEEES